MGWRQQKPQDLGHQPPDQREPVVSAQVKSEKPPQGHGARFYPSLRSLLLSSGLILRLDNDLHCRKADIRGFKPTIARAQGTVTEASSTPGTASGNFQILSWEIHSTTICGGCDF